MLFGSIIYTSNSTVRRLMLGFVFLTRQLWSEAAAPVNSPVGA